MQPDARSALPPPDLVDKIPLTARRVIILGCGDGTLGAEYRRRNPAAEIFGIERDPAMAERACAVLDRVYCLDLATSPLPRFGAPPDCILFSPGLFEALRRPADIVRDFAGLLAPGGVLVLCASGAVAEDERAAVEGLLLGAGLLALDCQEIVHADTPHHRVWRATGAPVERVDLLSTMLPQVGGVSMLRVVEPLCALRTEPDVTVHVSTQHARLPKAGESPGIFILHRPALLGDGGLQVIRQLIRNGWLVVCEFDDHPSQIPILHRSDVQNFRAVHAVQTSTPALAAVLRGENPEVMVFPNAARRLPVPRNFTTDERLTVMFAALNREEDWPDTLDAINEAAALAGPRLHFRVIADQAFFDALATPHKHFTPLCDYEIYLDILSRCEVSFMPLRDTMFNRCKSDLKYLEAAAHRVVALAAPVVYGESITDGVNGLVYDDPAGLRDRLANLVANPAAARAMADTAYGEVAKHRMLAYQVARRKAWYRSLWARREALSQAMFERVPELRPPG